MEKRIGSYETLYVLDATMTEEAIAALVEKFSSLVAANGTLESVDKWGKKKLAYPINDLTDGYFVLMSYSSPSDFPAEVARITKITDGVLRAVTTVALPKKATAPAKEEIAEAPAEEMPNPPAEEVAGE